VFPYINLVWLGLIIMGVGLFISMLHRINPGKTLTIVVLLIATAALFYMFLLAN